MRNYKLSRYNNIFKRVHGNYLWNTLTEALLRLDDNAISFLREYDGAEIKDNPYFQIFRKNGCIVPSGYDELNRVITDEKTTLLDPRPEIMHYTITPGLCCNYNCVYCFEATRESHMSMTAKVQDEVSEYIISEVKKNSNVRRLEIRWFGGEPLLYPEAIFHISERLMKFCRDISLPYTCGIVTNGRFLTKEIAERLKPYNVQYVQLAFDGTKEYYMSMKGASSSDFDATVQNIIKASEILPITVRINVSDQMEDVMKLTEYLLYDKKLDGKIRINIAHVRNYDAECLEDEISSHRHFLEFEGQYMKMFGPGGKYSSESLAYRIPKHRRATCYSVCSGNFCIGPEGEFYRCEHDFGKSDFVVGSISDGRYYSQAETRYLKFRHEEKCQKCGMLPVCLGGCMNDNVGLSCAEYKERLFDYLFRSFQDHRFPSAAH